MSEVRECPPSHEAYFWRSGELSGPPGTAAGCRGWGGMAVSAPASVGGAEPLVFFACTWSSASVTCEVGDDVICPNNVVGNAVCS